MLVFRQVNKTTYFILYILLYVCACVRACVRVCVCVCVCVLSVLHSYIQTVDQLMCFMSMHLTELLTSPQRHCVQKSTRASERSPSVTMTSTAADRWRSASSALARSRGTSPEVATAVQRGQQRAARQHDSSTPRPVNCARQNSTSGRIETCCSADAPMAPKMFRQMTDDEAPVE